jgi:hypothetical protein
VMLMVHPQYPVIDGISPPLSATTARGHWGLASLRRHLSSDKPSLSSKVSTARQVWERSDAVAKDRRTLASSAVCTTSEGSQNYGNLSICNGTSALGVPVVLQTRGSAICLAHLVFGWPPPLEIEAELQSHGSCLPRGRLLHLTSAAISYKFVTGFAMQPKKSGANEPKGPVIRPHQLSIVMEVSGAPCRQIEVPYGTARPGAICI